MNETKAILIDIGGVLVRTSDRSTRMKWENKLNLPEFELDNMVFGCEVAQMSTIGKASQAQVWDSVQERLKITKSELNMLKEDFWAKDFADKDLLQILRNLHNTLPIFILSNAWEGARMTFSSFFGLNEGDPFDRIFFSSEMGLAKPDPQIFREVSKTIDIPLNNILFVDDFEENITSANRLGMKTCHFKKPEEVMTFLESLVQ